MFRAVTRTRSPWPTPAARSRSAAAATRAAASPKRQLLLVRTQPDPVRIAVDGGRQQPRDRLGHVQAPTSARETTAAVSSTARPEAIAHRPGLRSTGCIFRPDGCSRHSSFAARLPNCARGCVPGPMPAAPGPVRPASGRARRRGRPARNHEPTGGHDGRRRAGRGRLRPARPVRRPPPGRPHRLLRARVDGVELEYEVLGAGDPVVLIHAGVCADWFAPLLTAAGAPRCPPHRQLSPRRVRRQRARRRSARHRPPGRPVRGADAPPRNRAGPRRRSLQQRDHGPPTGPGRAGQSAVPGSAGARAARRAVRAVRGRGHRSLPRRRPAGRGGRLDARRVRAGLPGRAGPGDPGSVRPGGDRPGHLLRSGATRPAGMAVHRAGRRADHAARARGPRCPQRRGLPGVPPAARAAARPGCRTSRSSSSPARTTCCTC